MNKNLVLTLVVLTTVAITVTETIAVACYLTPDVTFFQFLSSIRTIYLPTAVGLGFIVFWAFYEEVIYRALPVVGAAVLGSLFTKAVIPVVLILSSMLFGYVHGSLTNIYIQGFAGLVWSVEYYFVLVLDDYNFSKALSVTTAAHVLHNLILIGIGLG